MWHIRQNIPPHVLWSRSSIWNFYWTRFSCFASSVSLRFVTSFSILAHFVTVSVFSRFITRFSVFSHLNLIFSVFSRLITRFSVLSHFILIFSVFSLFSHYFHCTCECPGFVYPETVDSSAPLRVSRRLLLFRAVSMPMEGAWALPAFRSGLLCRFLGHFFVYAGGGVSKLFDGCGYVDRKMFTYLVRKSVPDNPHLCSLCFFGAETVEQGALLVDEGGGVLFASLLRGKHVGL